MTGQDPTVAVLGLGNVGEPMLHAVAAAGIPALGIDHDPDALARAERRYAAVADGCVRPEVTGDLSALARADVVIEALPDDFSTKSSVLDAVQETARPNAVLATTSVRSSIPRLAVASRRPQSTLGLRLLTPPAKGSAVEIVRTSMTDRGSAEVLASVMERAGLKQAPMGATASRYATRLVFAYVNRAVDLLAQGDIPRDAIDTAMRLGCGLPMGPLQLLDTVGIDAAHTALRALLDETGHPSFQPSPVLTGMLAEGRLGRKSRRGFYDYDESGCPLVNDPPLPADSPGHAIARVGVVGSGIMARGIAEVTALAGFPTVLIARSDGKAADARAGIEGSLTRGVRRGRIAPDERTSALARLETGTDPELLADCDLVVEAVVEDLDIKRELFTRLGKVCKPSAILATTTSSLPLSVCAQASARAERVVGMHFFNPAPTMKLMELASTETTGRETAAAAEAFCRALGKQAVRSPDRAGYIVNFLLFPYLADAIRLLEHPDADIDAVDDAIRSGYGYPMGPFALLDTIGLDVSLAILQQLHKEFSLPDLTPPEPLVQLVELGGALGRKDRRGFHLWPSR
ncbi:3-hydroxyacyl-CoA dehydrogenase family protein [Streptomyces sp. NPDC050759]|uniref:3-hydroxyacyl-CoA dehydrogenase family protein n=1 Tax=Streptomyces sp. NPDC050759 TaxID=3365635 RepID=UPI0037A03622